MAVTPKTYANILKYGTYANYQALETKDSNVLYFCTDVGKVFKGTIDFTESIIYSAERPVSPIAGKIYVIAATDTVEAYIAGNWKVLSYPTLKSTTTGEPGEEVDVSTISSSSTDMQVVSAKNVYLAIEEAKAEIEGGANVVKNITTNSGTENYAKFVVTKGNNSTSEITVPGVATKPTWDGTARVLTIPIAGEVNPVEVNIGKDIFIDPEAENGYDPDTGDIVIYLNDGTASSDPTEIRIPAGELLTIYNGYESNTVNLHIVTNQDPVTHKEQYSIVADAKVSTAAGNIISVNSSTGTEGGLYASVDLTPYVTNTDFQTYQNNMSTVISGLETSIGNNTSAINILNGDTATSGSVAKAVLDATNPLDTRLTTAEGDIDQVEADLAALATATTAWGTF